MKAGVPWVKELTRGTPQSLRTYGDSASHDLICRKMGIISLGSTNLLIWFCHGHVVLALAPE
jgi:hypothetical protein